MRVALLSLLERAIPECSGPERALVTDISEPRGCLRVAGRPVIRHQFSLALALDCTRIVVLSETMAAELGELQDLAEQRGVQFHVVNAARALLPLVAPEDELIVLDDGLLAMPQDALELVGQGHGVLVLPIETALAAGFERIDINHAAASAMRVPGRLVAGLADLPGDWDAPSALLRLAMQAGIRQVPVSAHLVESGRWTLVRSEGEALAIEPRWLRLHTGIAHGRSPGEGLAAFLVHWLGPAVLHAGTRPFMLSLAAVVLALLALGSGWLGVMAPAFLLLAAAWLIGKTSDLLVRVETDSLPWTKPWYRVDQAFSWAMDGLFVLLGAWRIGFASTSGELTGVSVFVPMVLFALLRLVPRLAPHFIEGSEDALWPRWLQDRFVIGLCLAIASAFAPFGEILMIASGLLLGAALIFPGFAKSDVPNRPLTKGR